MCLSPHPLWNFYFLLMLKHAFGNATEGIHMHTRSYDRLFNLSRLKTKSKIRRILIRDMMSADDAALVADSQDELQRLVDRFSEACSAIDLTIRQR